MITHHTHSVYFLWLKRSIKFTEWQFGLFTMSAKTIHIQLYLCFEWTSNKPEHFVWILLALWNLCSASVTQKFYKKVSLFSLVLLLAACCCCYVLELFTIWLGWILSFPKMPKPPTKCVYVSLSPYYNWLPIACGRAVVVCSLRLRVFIYILFILSFIFFFNFAFGIVISVFFSLMCVVAVVARYYEFLSTIYTHTNTLNIFVAWNIMCEHCECVCVCRQRLQHMRVTRRRHTRVWPNISSLMSFHTELCSMQCLCSSLLLCLFDWMCRKWGTMNIESSQPENVFQSLQLPIILQFI